MTERPASIPPNHLMEFILGLLTPLLMTSSITDIQLARLAATETIAAYNARGQHELLTIAQILGFALTALDNLRLSMPPGLSLSMKVKLRGNANALNRSALHSTQTLDKSRETSPPPARSLAEQAAMVTPNEAPADDQPEPQPAETIAIRQPAEPASIGQQNNLQWANAMRTQAAKLQASTQAIPAAGQKANRLWADVLTGVANELTQANRTPAPGMSKADLMRTTLMASGTGFPAYLATNTQHAPIRKRTR